MMRMRTSAPAAAAFRPMMTSVTEAEADEWEVRPCGMLVQKRSSDKESASPPAPTIRLRVKHGSNSHEIYISSQATFGELKKMLSAPTGLHHEDQKIVFKDKERQSSAFLDISGVKDRSKLVVMEDLTAHARRCLEMRRAAQVDRAAKSISKINLEVDKLVSKVSALESIVSKGKKVAESDILTLIELLMNELLKLDGVAADGDAKIQRRLQVRRVQKYVETLDAIKIKNEKLDTNQQTPPLAAIKIKNEKLERNQQKQQTPSVPADVVNKKWEKFDSLFSPSTSTTEKKAAVTTKSNPTPRFDWELF